MRFVLLFNLNIIFFDFILLLTSLAHLPLSKIYNYNAIFYYKITNNNLFISITLFVPTLFHLKFQVFFIFLFLDLITSYSLIEVQNSNNLLTLQFSFTYKIVF